MTANNSITAIFQKTLDNVETPHGVRLAFGDCIIDLKSNSLPLEKELTRYFSDFLRHDERAADIVIHAIETAPPSFDEEFTVKQPDPGKTKIKEEYLDLEDGRVIRKRLTDMVFLLGGERQMAVGPCEKNPNQVINFVNNRFIEWLVKKDYLLAHAAAIILEGKGLAMAGFSGMGKSTLALHLMSEGATFVSNDRLIVKKNGDTAVMEGVAKLPRINPGTALNNKDLQQVIPAEQVERFLTLPKEELWELEHKFDVFIDECFGENRFQLSSRMDAIVILNWQRNDSETKATVTNFNDRRDLLEAFMKPVGLFFEGGEETTIIPEERYLEELGDVPVLEISGGADFDKATRECINFLRNMKN